MSFFIKPGRSIERNQNVLKKNQAIKRKRRKTPVNGKVTSKKHDNSDEVESEEDEERPQQPTVQHAGEDEEEDAGETVQEKRLRLAKLYLEEIERREQSERDETSKERVTQHLKEDLLERSHRLQRKVAHLCTGHDREHTKILRCKEHRLTVTCLVVSTDGEFVYSGSKDSAIVKWSVSQGKKLNSIHGTKTPSGKHLGTVLCLALSTDSKFLASGGASHLVHIWDPDSLRHIHTFTGHKKAVTGLVFRRNAHTLFSVSDDQSVKLWNLVEMVYVETLFGHQSGVTGVDAMNAERAVTSGGRDNTLRMWKVVEETQLVFNGHKGSIDAVRLVNENHFVSCGDDGSLCLWGSMKKKPLCSVANAHGLSSENQEPNWISCVAALHNSDLIASGSRDGNIKLWQCGDGFRSLTHLLDIPVVGFVNALTFTCDGSCLVAGIGQEHRLGRWWTIKEAKNTVLIIPLLKSS